MKNEKKKCNSKYADIKSNQLSDNNLENVSGGAKTRFLVPYPEGVFRELGGDNTILVKNRYGYLIGFDNLEEAQRYGREEEIARKALHY